MISNKINTLLDELNSSNWNSVISTSKNAIMDLQLNEQYKTALLNLADFSVERRQ